MDDVLYAKVYATLRNLSDPIVVVNECPGTLSKTNGNDKESCDLKIVRIDTVDVKKNFGRVTPKTTFNFSKEDMWHKLSYKRSDCGTNTISREPAVGFWRWTK